RSSSHLVRDGRERKGPSVRVLGLVERLLTETNADEAVSEFLSHQAGDRARVETFAKRNDGGLPLQRQVEQALQRRRLSRFARNKFDLPTVASQEFESPAKTL